MLCSCLPGVLYFVCKYTPRELYQYLYIQSCFSIIAGGQGQCLAVLSHCKYYCIPWQRHEVSHVFLLFISLFLWFNLIWSFPADQVIYKVNGLSLIVPSAQTIMWSSSENSCWWWMLWITEVSPPNCKSYNNLLNKVKKKVVENLNHILSLQRPETMWTECVWRLTSLW